MKKISIFLLLSAIWFNSFAQSLPPDRVITTPIPSTGVNKGKQSDRYSNITAYNRFFLPKFANNTAFIAAGGKDSTSVYWNTTIERIVVSKQGGSFDTLSTAQSSTYNAGYGLLQTGNEFRVDTTKLVALNPVSPQNGFINVNSGINSINGTSLIGISAIGGGVLSMAEATGGGSLNIYGLGAGSSTHTLTYNKTNVSGYDNVAGTGYTLQGTGLILKESFSKLANINTNSSATGTTTYTLPPASGTLATVSTTVATVATIADLQAYSGSATSVNVTHWLNGGLFDYVAMGAGIIGDIGINIPATGKGGGYFVRRFSGPVDVKWFGAVPFDPFTQNNLTGTDAAPNINAAIKYNLRRNGQILISDNFLIKSPIELGEGTNITGLSRIFPYQLDSISNPPNIDTVKYANKSALWALNGTDAFVTTLDTVTYRNQGIKIANIGIYGSGKNNGKAGILFRDNPNSSMSIKRPGLIQISNVAVANFTTLLDGRGSADSWDINEQTHLSDAKYGLRTGLSDLKFISNVVYNIDSIGLELNGRHNVVIGNEIEVGTDSLRIGVMVNGFGSIIESNVFKETGKPIVVAASAVGTNITVNNILGRWRGITLESGSNTTMIKSNMFGSFSNVFTPVAGLLFINDKGSTFTHLDANTFRKMGGPQLKPVHFHNATNLTLGFNTVNGFTLPDAREFTFSGTNTFNRYTIFNDINLQGRMGVGNGLLTTGSLNMFSDNNSGLATFAQRVFGVPLVSLVQRYNGTLASSTALTNGAVIKRYAYQGYNGSSLTGDRAEHRIEADGNWTSILSGAKQIWAITPNGANSMTDKLELNGNGLDLKSGRFGFNGSFGSALQSLRNNAANTGMEFYTPASMSDLSTTKKLTGSGTGSSTTISIAHGLSGITSASSVVASANTSVAGGYSYVDIDATNVNFYYTVAPAAGTNNLIYSVTIK